MNPLRVKQVGSRTSPDGREIILKFLDGAGGQVEVSAATNEIPAIVEGIERQMGNALELQRRVFKGVDPRLTDSVRARSVEKIQGAVSTEGVPVLSIETKTGMRLDLALDRSHIEGLLEFFEALRDEANGPERKPS